VRDEPSEDRSPRPTLAEEPVAEVDGAPGAAGNATRMGRRQVRGSSLLLVGRILSLVLTTATQIVIVRYLSKTDYGGFAYALALGSAGRTLLSLGQGRLLSRFMSTYEEQRDYNRMFGSMALAAGTIVITSVVTMTVLFVFRDALIAPAVGDSTAVQMVLILAFLAPLEAFDQVFVSLFAVFSRPRAIFFRKYLLTPGLRLVVVVGLVATGSSVTFLAIGYVAAQLIGLFVYLSLLATALRQRGLLKHLHPRRLVMPYRAVFAFSFPLITGELVYLSMNTGGVMLLAFYQSVEEVANYRAVFPAARLNQVIMQVFVTLFLPMAARLHLRGDIDGLRRSYWHTAVFVAVLTFPVFALTGPLAGVTTEVLFGVRYAESAIVLALLSTGYYVNVMLGFNTFTLQVCGRIRYQVWVNVVVAVLNFGLSLALVPHFAAAGVAAANCVTLIVQNVLNQWALRSSLGTAFVERRYLPCYASIVLGAAALWGFRLTLAPGIVVSLIAATVVSLAVLVLSRPVLELGETFPELRKVPLLGRVIG
jgi:O-antigen/teichoic acid export membrane protein